MKNSPNRQIKTLPKFPAIYYGIPLSINAAKPAKPNKVYGSIIVIENVSISLINWDPPQNQNETDIVFYDIILLRSHSLNGTNSIHVAASRQTLSYKYAVSDSGNYTAASITAVDLCGQRSEASEFQLIPVTYSNGSITNPESNDHDGQKSNTVYILAGIFTAAIAIIIIAIYILSIIVVHRHIINQQEAKCNHNDVVKRSDTSNSIANLITSL